MNAELTALSSTIEQGGAKQEFIKLICAKPKNGHDFLKAELLVVQNKDQSQSVKVTRYTKTQSFTETSPFALINEVLATLFEEQFYFGDAFFTDKTLHFKSNKKQTATLITKANTTNTKSSNNKQHDREKNYVVSADRPYLHLLGVTSSNGLVHNDKYGKYRQINRFVELVLQHTDFDKEGDYDVVDMGSGKGYLTFALHDVLSSHAKQVKTTGFELREDLVKKCNDIASKVKMPGLSFVASDIFAVEYPKIDLLIALHACDIATDLAIKKGVDANAKYIVLSPCCHKQIRKAINKKNSITHYGIYKERMAEMVTDTIRALLLEHLGYRCQIMEYVSSEHTGKNTMIIAKYAGQSDESALGQVSDLKQQYGIDQHYLESLLDIG